MADNGAASYATQRMVKRFTDPATGGTILTIHIRSLKKSQDLPPDTPREKANGTAVAIAVAHPEYTVTVEDDGGDVLFMVKKMAFRIGTKEGRPKA